MPLAVLPATTPLVKVVPAASLLDTKVRTDLLRGSVSIRVAPATALGPASTKVTVKVVVCQSANEGVLATLVADKSVRSPTPKVAVEILLAKIGSLALLGAATLAWLIGAPLASAEALRKNCDRLDNWNSHSTGKGRSRNAAGR